MIIKEIYNYLDSLAPYNTQCVWDNSGFMCGNLNAETDSVMVCLDCTNDVIEQAKSKGCNVVVCHHPMIFAPLKKINEGDAVYNAVRNDITVISAHTNLDMAKGGVNDILCEKLCIKDAVPVVADDAPILRAGVVDECSAENFAKAVAAALDASVQLVSSGRKVNRVAVCGGAAGEYLTDAFAAGCDTYITGEAKHHEFIEAGKLGLNLLVAGHYSTEIPVVEKLCSYIINQFPGLDVYAACEECPYETVV